jgi:hypothetical protein
MCKDVLAKLEEQEQELAEKDKVIAELKDKALQYKVLDKEHCRDLNTQERFFAKQIAHNKYKRCLAMARWCASRSASWCFDPADEQLHKSEFYDKWTHCWLELAEKFKPNN